jgi:oxygen-independent coproporphyrinogen III oxidase
VDWPVSAARSFRSGARVTSDSSTDTRDPQGITAPWPHIYLHVPFCGRRCSYCDFAIAVRRDVPVSEFNDAIMAELVTRQIPPSSVPIRSIYLGGGTPSKLGGLGVAELVASVARQLGVEKLSTSPDELEVTIEVNPEDVTLGAAQAWAAAGVNRASIGVQSFDPAVLRWMHRDHSPAQVRAAVDTLREAGIQELSLDLIFAVPESLNRSWTKDIDEVLKLDPDHLSLYGLTVEPKTPLGRWTARGEVAEAPEERYESEFLEADRRLRAAGFEHYEVSNYGLPGKRARHNSAYWSGAPYLGLGPSAHGFSQSTRRWNRPAYADWLRSVQTGEDPIAGSEEIGPAEQLAESVYLGLRTTDGLSISQTELKTVTPWIEAGWGELREDAPSDLAGAAKEASGGLGSRVGGGFGESVGRLVLTATGWLRLDSLAAALTSLRSPS